MKIKYQKTKTLVTKHNNNSSDAISPNYIYGCAGGCGSYCYMKRYNQNTIYINTNINDIEQSVHTWVTNQPFPKISNQQDHTYYMIDIGCNTDMALHQKHLTKVFNDFYIVKLPGDKKTRLFGLEYILSFYSDHPKLNSTFATKYPSMLKLNINHFKKNPESE
jgi:spore photoproduct lyase